MIAQSLGTDLSMKENKPAPVADPVISVCRHSRSYACFDGITLIRDFRPYRDETEAINEATFWFR